MDLFSSSIQELIHGYVLGLLCKTNLCVIIHYIINDEVGTVKLVKALEQFSY